MNGCTCRVVHGGGGGGLSGRAAAGGGGAPARAAVSRAARSRPHAPAAPALCAALITTFPHWDRSACLHAPRTDNDSSRSRRDTVPRVLLDVLPNTNVLVLDCLTCDFTF